MPKKKAKKKAVKKVEHGFVFIGNGNSDPKSIRYGDYTFRLNGKAVEVDERLAARLRGNYYWCRPGGSYIGL